MREVRIGEDMSTDTGIWVVAHSSQDKVPQVTFELIGKAKALGTKFDEKVTAAIIGHGMKKSLLQPYAYGADEVIYVDEENLKDYDANSYANVLEVLIGKYKPASVLFGADSVGRDLAPRIGVRLETGISADCIDLDMDIIDGAKLLMQKKPYLNGEVVVDILCKERRPQMATVKPGMLELVKPDESKSGTPIREEVKVNDAEILTRIIKSIPRVECENDICKADVIVAGGRGFKTKGDFDRLQELADLIGGMVGATRPIVQEGWISEEFQIGQSGKIVKPKLYIAFGISGAVMHTGGVIKPGTFIAVNENPEAPIFNVAHYGVAGDCKDVLASLIETLKK
ncbi:electron transfer flavoprotein subunit alpha/FixB family protein [Youngiibacter fragilis]|nr:electron transfer flavoprotein subunit alpha/FixB family protein [Youngiibacter fragilis]